MFLNEVLFGLLSFDDNQTVKMCYLLYLCCEDWK